MSLKLWAFLHKVTDSHAENKSRDYKTIKHNFKKVDVSSCLFLLFGIHFGLSVEQHHPLQVL